MSKINNKDHQFCLLTDMMVAEKSPIKLHKKHYEPCLLAERVLSSSDTKLAAPGVRLPEEDEMRIMVLVMIIVIMLLRMIMVIMLLMMILVIMVLRMMATSDLPH